MRLVTRGRLAIGYYTLIVSYGRSSAIIFGERFKHLLRGREHFKEPLAQMKEKKEEKENRECKNVSMELVQLLANTKIFKLLKPRGTEIYYYAAYSKIRELHTNGYI